MTPEIALRGFLAGLGVPSASVPASLDELSALFRSLVADLRVLVVLDNARDSAQVLPLLPGGAGCSVVVTSRHRLTGVMSSAGALPVALDVLSTMDARDVLAAHVGGHRVAAEPGATGELLGFCAGSRPGGRRWRFWRSWTRPRPRACAPSWRHTRDRPRGLRSPARAGRHAVLAAAPPAGERSYGAPVPVDVLLQHRDLTDADLAHVTAVAADVDRWRTCPATSGSSDPARRKSHYDQRRDWRAAPPTSPGVRA